jgi:hypothetical protein
MMLHAPKVTAADLAGLALGRPPFVSVYLDLSAEHRDTLSERIAAVADGLLELGATPEMVKRATTPFLAPRSDRAAMGVVCSTDGRSMIASSPEPLARDLGDLAPVPRLAPMIEWGQQMVTHAVIRRGDDEGVQLTVFGADGTSEPAAAADDDRVEELVERAVVHEPSVVFVIGDRFAPLVERFHELIVTNELRPDCRIVELADGTDGDVADAVVRHTASVVAERQVELLRDFRFERAHGQAVEGVDDVLDAVNAGRVSTLLVDADPDDHRRLVVGPDARLTRPNDPPDPDGPPRVHLAEGLIWATLARGGQAVVMPSTGERGPDDDVGALLSPRPPAGLLRG